MIPSCRVTWLHKGNPDIDAEDKWAGHLGFMCLSAKSCVPCASGMLLKNCYNEVMNSGSAFHNSRLKTGLDQRRWSKTDSCPGVTVWLAGMSSAELVLVSVGRGQGHTTGLSTAGLLFWEHCSRQEFHGALADVWKGPKGRRQPSQLNPAPLTKSELKTSRPHSQLICLSIYLSVYAVL